MSTTLRGNPIGPLSMISAILASVGLFAMTNIDDTIVVTVLFLAVKRGALRARHVIVGQYVGVGSLIAFSMAAAYGLTVLPDRYVGLFGIVPLGIGLLGMAKYLRALLLDAPPSMANVPIGALGIIGITIANGADNIAVYTPLFRSLSLSGSALTVLVFFALIGVVIAIGRLIAGHPQVRRLVHRAQAWLVPLLFCMLGLYVLSKAGSARVTLARRRKHWTRSSRVRAACSR